MTDHPFTGGTKRPTVTKQHWPLIWECMLGTVYAMDPDTKAVRYFDYDYDAARAYAKIDNATDLRISRNKRSVAYSVTGENPYVGQIALWGIPKEDSAEMLFDPSRFHE